MTDLTAVVVERSMPPTKQDGAGLPRHRKRSAGWCAIARESCCCNAHFWCRCCFNAWPHSQITQNGGGGAAWAGATAARVTHYNQHTFAPPGPLRQNQQNTGSTCSFTRSRRWSASACSACQTRSPAWAGDLASCFWRFRSGRAGECECVCVCVFVCLCACVCVFVCVQRGRN